MSTWRKLRGDKNERERKGPWYSHPTGWSWHTGFVLELRKFMGELFPGWCLDSWPDDSALLISIDGGGGPDPAFIYVSRNFSPSGWPACILGAAVCTVSSLPCYLHYPHTPVVVPAEETLHTPLLESGVAVLSDSDTTQRTKSLPHADRSLQGTVTG